MAGTRDTGHGTAVSASYDQGTSREINQHLENVGLNIRSQIESIIQRQ